MTLSALTRRLPRRSPRRAPSRRAAHSAVAGGLLLLMALAVLQPLWGAVVDHHYGEKRAAARAGYTHYEVAPHTHDDQPGPTRPALASLALSAAGWARSNTPLWPAALQRLLGLLRNRAVRTSRLTPDGLLAVSAYEPPPPDQPPRL